MLQLRYKNKECTMPKYVYIFDPDTEYKILRTEEKAEIRRAVVQKLSQEGWCGYNVQCDLTGRKVFHQQYVFRTLKSLVLRIVKYIYDRGLCHITFLKQVTQEELRRIYVKGAR